ncbi:MAG: hypothetical protein COT84_07725 [Chlamydiae bacterium CG10_big_fil_rev_8_21_14_0_10_35_9]|nr:MAG: hypothetical protein COT84_07725 [Chlamydiae bacterium CG10_big_fil_rev_8_21_14_0_10_35_9]
MRFFSKQFIINELFIKSWWVISVCLLCFLGYNHFAKKRKHDIFLLQEKLAHLELARDKALQEKDDLSLQICSQSDPAWIELILMKQLGVVPEGYLKIHFKKE